MGKRGGPVQAHGDAALEIGRDQQRQLRILLQAIEQLGRLEGLAAVQKGQAPSGTVMANAPMWYLRMVSRSCRYSGLLTLRNSARTQIMNSCPTFSSSESLRRVLSAHFSPSRSRWMGPACEYFSLAGAITLAESRRKTTTKHRIMEGR